MIMLPSGTDSAPYLRALVPNSCRSSFGPAGMVQVSGENWLRIGRETITGNRRKCKYPSKGFTRNQQ
jgi:hypothetical protein